MCTVCAHRRKLGSYGSHSVSRTVLIHDSALNLFAGQKENKTFEDKSQNFVILEPRK